MTPETIYQESVDPKNCCDIGLHLPYLRSIARGKIVEIGTRFGASTSAFLLGLRERGGHLYSVDTEDEADCAGLFDDPHWTFIHGHSTNDAVAILRQLPISIDILFIDANHAYESVIADLATYGLRVRAGGMILLHDTELQGAGVMRAAQEYAAARNAEFMNRPGCYGMGKIQC